MPLSPDVASLTIAPTSGSITSNLKTAFNPDFYQRVALAAVATAFSVIAEDPTTTNHVNRASHAAVIIATASTDLTQVNLALAVVSDWSTGIDSTDQQLLDRLAALWDDLSGIPFS